ncbi:MAG: response regulator, partial [Planktomarina temperata]|nr:response regulator [Planktomarina temperata]
MPRIVLVDDDRSYMMSLSMMLEAEGFEVECYFDGLAAWESFSKSLPDILVLEAKLPGLDGMDVLQRLRQVSTIPVMFCTAKDDEID